MRQRGKSRCNWRFCQICKKENEPVADNPMVIVCDCGIKYVHYNCQANLMTSTALIHCDTCKAQFVGVDYTYSNKNFFQYIWEDSHACNRFLTIFSMVFPMFLTVATLFGTFFANESSLNEMFSFEFDLDKEAIKNNLNIIMLWNMKLVLPLLFIFYTGRSVYSFICDFLEWKEKHFNITIKPPELKRKASQDGKQN